MSKSIFWLLSLLLLVMVACVYQKAESIYQLKHPIITSPKTFTLAIKKPIIEEKKPILPKTIIPLTIEEKPIVVLAELKASVTQALSSSNAVNITKEESKEMMHKAIISVSETKEVPIDYLLSVLNEREKVMDALYEVIVEALYNRRIAIENRNNIFIEMELKQKGLIKKRDEMYHSIPTLK